MARIAKIPDPHVLYIIPSPDPYGYRNRITVHAEEGRIGFRSTDGRRLVDIRKCLLASEEVNASLTDLRRRRPRAGHYSLRAASIPQSAFHQANQLLLDQFCDATINLLPPLPPGATQNCLELYSGGGFFTQRLSALGQTAAPGE